MCESQAICGLTLKLSRKERHDYLRRVFFAQKQLNKNLLYLNRKTATTKDNIKMAEELKTVDGYRLKTLMQMLE